MLGMANPIMIAKTSCPSQAFIPQPVLERLPGYITLIDIYINCCRKKSGKLHGMVYACS